jgi:hypothetical protein
MANDEDEMTHEQLIAIQARINEMCARLADIRAYGSTGQMAGTTTSERMSETTEALRPTWHAGMYGAPQDMYGASVVLPLVAKLKQITAERDAALAEVTAEGAGAIGRARLLGFLRAVIDEDPSFTDGGPDSGGDHVAYLTDLLIAAGFGDREGASS